MTPPKCPRCKRRPGRGGGGLLAYCRPCAGDAARDMVAAREAKGVGPRELRARALLKKARALDRALGARDRVTGNVDEAAADYRRAVQAFVRAEVSR